jgi:SAM-dependent methyltransferase
MLNAIKNHLWENGWRENAWENMVSIASFDDRELGALDPASAWLPGEDAYRERLWHDIEDRLELAWPQVLEAVGKDPDPLPSTADREGYYGDDHFKYWASGLREMHALEHHAAAAGLEIRDYLDFGCATGRVLRHFARQRPGMRVCGVDLNRRHVDWIAKYLAPSIEVAQTTSLPHLPFRDASFDLISAFSVFTHIEAFETAWLLELKRILRAGGLLWITIHSEHTWERMRDFWPLHIALRGHPDFQPFIAQRPALPGERLVFRHHARKSYSANVFYHTDYLRRVWGRFFDIVAIHQQLPDFQDVIVLRHRA